MINKDLLQAKKIGQGNLYEINKSQQFDETLQEGHLYYFVAFGISGVYYQYMPFIFKKNNENLCRIQFAYYDGTSYCRWRIDINDNSFFINNASVNMATNTAILECWQII